MEPVRSKSLEEINLSSAEFWVAPIEEREGGFATLREQNPIADRVLSAWGGWGLAGFKAIVTSIACAAIWMAIKKGWPKHQRLLTFAISAAVVLQVLLLAHWARCLAQFL